MTVLKLKRLNLSQKPKTPAGSLLFSAMLDKRALMMFGAGATLAYTSISLFSLLAAGLKWKAEDEDESDSETDEVLSTLSASTMTESVAPAMCNKATNTVLTMSSKARHDSYSRGPAPNSVHTDLSARFRTSTPKSTDGGKICPRIKRIEKRNEHLISSGDGQNRQQLTTKSVPTQTSFQEVSTRGKKGDLQNGSSVPHSRLDKDPTAGDSPQKLKCTILKPSSLNLTYGDVNKRGRKSGQDLQHSAREGRRASSPFKANNDPSQIRKSY